MDGPVGMCVVRGEPAELNMVLTTLTEGGFLTP